uniref:Uncharacterized protein n=1 Tax=Sphingomonas sp. SH TaxID=849864 RepID=A0A125QWT8_9SPHN|nr:hypothetical protein [Sphingomonas sp. SH]
MARIGDFRRHSLLYWRDFLFLSDFGRNYPAVSDKLCRIM